MSLAHSLGVKRTDDVILDNSTNANFDSLMLDETLLGGLLENGFKKLSPIQLKALPLGRCGFDLIVKAKSGTGKTLVFSIIALETIVLTNNQIQVLILAPTREIAVQIQEVLQCIGSHIEGLRVESFIGGLSIEGDKERCKICHIAVGAPGRVKHLLKEGILKTDSVRLFVLDEADKLMESTFQSDINEIYNTLPDRKQIITTSATYPNELEAFLNKYMLSPSYVTVESTTPLLLGVKQFVKIVKPCSNVVQQMKVKNEEILNIISNISFTQCIVFTNYQTRAQSISNNLNNKGWNSTYISAAQSQTDRLTAINSLKSFKCRILLSTDLTARGIDAANVDLVINYDIPYDSLTYLHRMGRSGRYGSLGVCINLALNGAELQQLQKILGEIGGTSLSIPILPAFEGTLSDLIIAEVLSENYISGLVPTAEMSQSNAHIKNKLFELKKVKDKPYIEHIQGLNSNIKGLMKDATENSSDKFKKVEDNIMDILNNTKKEDKMISAQFSEVDTTALLNSLASGDFKIDTISSQISDKTTDQQLYNDECKKRKRTDDSNGSIEKDISGQEMKEIKTKLYYKNKALLAITKLLCDGKCNVDKSDINFIRQYLEILINQNKRDVDKFLHNCSSVDSKELLESIEIHINHNDCLDNIENIFKIGYESVAKSNSIHWKSYLSDSEVENLEKLCAKEDINEEETDGNDWECDENYMEEEYENEDQSYDDEYKNEESDEHLQTEELKEIANHENDSNDNLMKWLPVEKSEGKVVRVETDVTDWENLNTHFNECNDNLWQNGLSFDTVDAFDEWFYYEWQAQVVGIRNYIQQNIYVQEMSRYQQMTKK